MKHRDAVKFEMKSMRFDIVSHITTICVFYILGTILGAFYLIYATPPLFFVIFLFGFGAASHIVYILNLVINSTEMPLKYHVMTLAENDLECSAFCRQHFKKRNWRKIAVSKWTLAAVYTFRYKKDAALFKMVYHD